MNIKRSKLTLPRLGSVSINFYGESCQRVVNLYNKLGEFERQKEIKHLGLIAYEIDGAKHTRYEYLMLQCALVDILDRLHKGNSSAQGEIKINGTKHLGSSILKSWFLLSNLGHLKNTFGDEKPLLFYALKTKGFRSHLINKVQSQALKLWMEAIIDNFEYEKFHFVIAIYRVYNSLRASENRESIIILFELLLLSFSEINLDFDATRLHQLQLLYQKIRDIAIISIDSHYSHTPINIDLTATLVSMDEFEGGVFGKDLKSALEPFRRYLYEEIYLNPNALANQRSYEIKVAEQLGVQTRTPKTYKTTIDKALSSGIIEEHKRFLVPFCRIDVSPESQPNRPFINEFRTLVSRVKKNCQQVDAYLDVNPYTEIWHVDFFIDENFSDSNLPRFLSNICNLIKDSVNDLIENLSKDYINFIDEIRNSALDDGFEANIIDGITYRRTDFLTKKLWERVNTQLFPCFEKLIWGTIKHFFKSQYRFEITDKNSPYSLYAYSFDEMGDNHLKQIFDKAISYELGRDKDRAHELKTLQRSSIRKHQGYTLVCLGRVTILDMTESPEKMKVTDIDGILLKVSDEKVSLQLN